MECELRHTNDDMGFIEKLQKNKKQKQNQRENPRAKNDTDDGIVGLHSKTMIRHCSTK